MEFDISCFVARPLFYAGTFQDIPGQPHKPQRLEVTAALYKTALVFPSVLGKSVLYLGPICSGVGLVLVD